MTKMLGVQEEPAIYKVLLGLANTVPLAHVTEFNPRRHSVPPADADLVSFVPMRAVTEESGHIDSEACRPWSEVKKGYTAFQNGDVIFAKITPCMENGKFALASALHGGRAAGSTEFHVFRAKPGLLPKYLFHFLFTPYVRRGAKRNMKGAAGQLRVPIQFFEGLRIPLPAPEEQKRVVDYLDEQLSRLDASVAALHRVKANLKRYRASVLKSACEGRLVPTEAELARKEGRNLESGAQLLQRVLVERRAHWRGKRAYEEPELADVAGLPELPSGWTWIPFGCLGVDPLNTVQTGPFGAQLHNTEFKETGVPVIAVGNLTGTGFRREGLYFVDDAKASQLSRYDVHAGDVLFARSGATLGKVCVAPHDVRDWRMTGHILRARLNMQFILPDIAVYALAALPSVRKQIFGNVRGVTRPGFNTGLLESIFVPLPPLAEQHRIVAEADRRLSLVRMAEAQVSANLARAQRLRQSILQAAFSG